MKNASSTTPIPRPPIVAIMGHIDHGKSTLLDYIRKTKVVDSEAGGITQHVSAYEVEHPTADGKQKRITFLDTPGHAAFQGIRTRGAAIADIAILVVSAEDGVKTQTVEAYKSIEEAKLPYIVAINKIDKPNANVPVTKQSLAEAGIYLEGWGGTIPSVEISAKTGQGVPELLETIGLVAELENISGNPDVSPTGVILESAIDPKKGISATLIIKDGTVHSGGFVVSGTTFAPLRIMENFLGKKVTDSPFSSPLRVVGWTAVPTAGDQFVVVESKKEAESLVNEKKRAKAHGTERDESTALIPTLPLIIRADALGSLEAIVHETAKMPADKLRIKIIQSGIGAVSESDVKTAVGIAGATVIAFHTKITPEATNIAERNGITIQSFDIIYKLIEWIEEHLKTQTPKQTVEEVTGRAKVLKFFSKMKDKQVIGARVEEGVIKENGKIRIMRREAVIGEGHIRELQQMKKRIGMIAEGECGMMIESKMEVAPGDKLEYLESVER